MRNAAVDIILNISTQCTLYSTHSTAFQFTVLKGYYRYVHGRASEKGSFLNFTEKSTEIVLVFLLWKLDLTTYLTIRIECN